MTQWMNRRGLIRISLACLLATVTIAAVIVGCATVQRSQSKEGFMDPTSVGRFNQHRAESAGEPLVEGRVGSNDVPAPTWYGEQQAADATVPWTELLTYPADWPELSKYENLRRVVPANSESWGNVSGGQGGQQQQYEQYRGTSTTRAKLVMQHSLEVHSADRPLSKEEKEAQRQKVNELIKRAKMLHDEGKKQDANRLIDQAIFLDPNNELLANMEIAAGTAAFDQLYAEFAAKRGIKTDDNAQPQPNEEPVLSEEEEIWILVKDDPKKLAKADLMPGSGALVTKVGKRQVPIPLKHTSVQANISAYISSVDVTQQFHNPFNEKIEAVYVFPLPQNAAVNDFVMTVGERKIRGIIREREEAERIYQAAKQAGHVASLLTQERPNIFTQKVANIEPGKQIDVTITYFNTLKFEDGSFEFVFPMVVGPRFNPPSSPDPIAAVPSDDQKTAGKAIRYLRPDERSSHDIDLTVNIDAGVSIESIDCDSHKIVVQQTEKAQATVKLAKEDRIPNKDFVLRYKVAGEKPKVAMLTHEDQAGKYFTMMIVPPAEKKGKDQPRQPMEMVFVFDVSGSMSGFPIEESKKAALRVLDKLDSQDSVQVVVFSNDADKFSTKPIPATIANKQKARQFIEDLNGGGGTMMAAGMKAALPVGEAPDLEKSRYVMFLTDGYIGNEAEILKLVDERLGQSRVFSFGVGSSVNRYLMMRMAKLGQGVASFVGNGEDSDEVVDRFWNRVSRSPLTNVAIDWDGLDVSEVYPARLPDLFAGSPIVVTGKFTQSVKANVRIEGTRGGERVATTVAVDPSAKESKHQAIAAIWARSYLMELHETMVVEGDNSGELKQAMLDTALNYKLMSQLTAFVAVDSAAVTEGAQGTTVHVAVPVPEGVKYETTVGQAGGEKVEQ